MKQHETFFKQVDKYLTDNGLTAVFIVNKEKDSFALLKGKGSSIIETIGNGMLSNQGFHTIIVRAVAMYDRNAEKMSKEN